MSTPNAVFDERGDVGGPQRPQVSVVLPVRDGAAFLADAIASVLNQTLHGLELIVVDDGSVDTSVAIARRAAARDDRVTVVTSDGCGVAAALNTGVACAKADWIGRLDADDMALPQRFARQLDLASARDDVVAWAAWAQAVDVDGALVSAMYQGPRSERQFQRQHRRGRLRPIHTTMIVRRDMLGAVGGYDPSADCAQDIELWDRLGELGPILTVPEVVTHVRVHADSATSRQLEATLEIHRFVVARRRAARRGQSLDLTAFRAHASRRGPLRRLPERCSIAARRRYRDAGVAYAAGQRPRAVWLVSAAMVVAPAIVVPRIWRQVLGMRLARLFVRLGNVVSARSSSPTALSALPPAHRRRRTL